MFAKILIANLAGVVERQDAVNPVAYAQKHFTSMVSTA